MSKKPGWVLLGKPTYKPVKTHPKLIQHHVQKIVPPASNMANSVCSSRISSKYHILYYLNITYSHTDYDVCSLPCVLSVKSSWRQGFFTLSFHSIHCYWQRD